MRKGIASVGTSPNVSSKKKGIRFLGAQFSRSYPQSKKKQNYIPILSTSHV